MPRAARLDTPGTLHHVIGRGIERRAIFQSDRDREDFLRRVGALAIEKAWTVYAWALIPNHFHLLVRTLRLPLSRIMRRLMTGYAVSFNRRHSRAGHLFQNRFKSVVVEEERYFLELVRYLHLNPLRAGLVQTLEELDGYAFSGHSVLMGRVERDWQETGEVLGRYGSRTGMARLKYHEFVALGLPQGQRPDLMGGGLIRSAGSWQAVNRLRRGRESFVSDERVLGSGKFVEGLVREAEKTEEEREKSRRRVVSLEVLVDRLSHDFGVSSEALWGGSRRREISRARSVLAFVWVEQLGRSGRELARALGVSPVSIWQAARRAEPNRAKWEKNLGRWCQ